MKIFTIKIRYELGYSDTAKKDFDTHTTELHTRAKTIEEAMKKTIQYIVKEAKKEGYKDNGKDVTAFAVNPRIVKGKMALEVDVI